MYKEEHNVGKLLKNLALILFILDFPSIFVQLKVTCCLVTLFDCKYQVFKKWTIFGIFNQLLSTLNLKVARFARNLECDFLGDLQTLWLGTQVNYIVGITFFLLSVDFEGEP